RRVFVGEADVGFIECDDMPVLPGVCIPDQPVDGADRAGAGGVLALIAINEGPGADPTTAAGTHLHADVEKFGLGVARVAEMHRDKLGHEALSGSVWTRNEYHTG